MSKTVRSGNYATHEFRRGNEEVVANELNDSMEKLCEKAADTHIVYTTPSYKDVVDKDSFFGQSAIQKPSPMTNELFFTKNKVAPCVENDISLQTAKANKKKEKDFSKSAYIDEGESVDDIYQRIEGIVPTQSTQKSKKAKKKNNRKNKEEKKIVEEEEMEVDIALDTVHPTQSSMENNGDKPSFVNELRTRLPSPPPQSVADVKADNMIQAEDFERKLIEMDKNKLRIFEEHQQIERDMDQFTLAGKKRSSDMNGKSKDHLEKANNSSDAKDMKLVNGNANRDAYAKRMMVPKESADKWKTVEKKSSVRSATTTTTTTKITTTVSLEKAFINNKKNVNQSSSKKKICVVNPFLNITPSNTSTGINERSFRHDRWFAPLNNEKWTTLEKRKIESRKTEMMERKKGELVPMTDEIDYLQELWNNFVKQAGAQLEYYKNINTEVNNNATGNRGANKTETTYSAKAAVLPPVKRTAARRNHSYPVRGG